MASASVQYTFAPNTDILSSEVNTNFQDLVTFLNGSVIHKDGSVAATGHLSGPATDPVSDNQYARKAYVDRLGIQTPQFSSTSNSVGYTSDTVTDFVLTNVPVVAGRTYGIHLHASYTVNSGPDSQWNLMIRLNGVNFKRIAWIHNQGSGALNGLVDGWVFWSPSVTASTDDLDLFVDEISGSSTLTFNGGATEPRTLSIIDFGVL